MAGFQPLRRVGDTPSPNRIIEMIVILGYSGSVSGRSSDMRQVALDRVEPGRRIGGIIGAGRVDPGPYPRRSHGADPIARNNARRPNTTATGVAAASRSSQPRFRRIACPISRRSTPFRWEGRCQRQVTLSRAGGGNRQAAIANGSAVRCAMTFCRPSGSIPAYGRSCGRNSLRPPGAATAVRRSDPCNSLCGICALTTSQPGQSSLAS